MSLELEVPRYGKGSKINFGSVFCAPGARGFYGEGYPFHAILRFAGLTWKGTAFAGKTFTLEHRKGNMPLKIDGTTPRESVPKCIIVKPWSGHVLNAVGLSNRGVEFYIDSEKWQKIRHPFCLSFMAIEPTKQRRLDETRDFVSVTKKFFQNLRTPVALQVNFACPNAEVHREELGSEVLEMLSILADLEIPLIPNFNPLVPVEVLKTASDHPACSALWIANTIPWGTPGIDWKGIFGVETSPLIERGFEQAGGLSGPECLLFTSRTVYAARKAGITIPIVAGNGIQHASDVVTLQQAGADAIAIGCVAIVRPWRMRHIIRTAYHCFS